MIRSPQPQGMVALLAVVLIGALGMASVAAILLLGTDASRTAFFLQQSAQAAAAADTCAEYALNELRKDISYAGGQTLEFGSFSCQVLPLSYPSIQVQGRSGAMLRKAEIQVSASDPQIAVGSWKELADF